MLEEIKLRRSVRKYKKNPIAKEELIQLVKAGMQAPSAANGRPWNFIFVMEKDSLKKLSEVSQYSGMNAEAAACIVVVADPSLSPFPQYFAQDCAASVQNILLEAVHRGIGAVWQGIYPDKDREEKMREMFRIPEEKTPFALIALGYPEKEPQPVDRFEEEKLFFETMN